MDPLPVQKQFEVQIPSGEQISNQTVSIPSGKQMRITHVSGSLWLPSPQTAEIHIYTAAFQIDVPGSTTGIHFFPLIAQPDGSVKFAQSTNIPTMGGDVTVWVWRSGTSGTLIGQITIVGELSDAPSPSAGNHQPEQPRCVREPAELKHGALANEAGHLRLFELAGVVVRFDHFAHMIANANHSVCERL